jgi:hypothetical protein
MRGTVFIEAISMNDDVEVLHEFEPLLRSTDSLLILNERWTRVINLSMFFLLCYDLLTTILRSWALHRVLSLAIQYAWCSYMLSRLYRKVKTFRSDLLTYLLKRKVWYTFCMCHSFYWLDCIWPHGKYYLGKSCLLLCTMHEDEGRKDVIDVL